MVEVGAGGKILSTLTLLWTVSTLCSGSPRLSAVDRTTVYPPCVFNQLCSCSKTVPDLGIVWCRNVPMPRAPLSFNSSKVFMLHLDNNGLRSLEPHFLMGTGLYRLEVSRNPLSSVADEALLGLERSLWELELRFNSLTTVPSRSLRHLQKLRLLDLTGNDISEVSHESWRGLEHSLQTLILARNAIASFSSPGTFSALQALQSLDLSGNQIAELDGSSLFSSPHHLHYLHLADNQMQWIPYLQVSHLRSLRTLDMSSNRLFSLEAQPGATPHEQRLRLIVDELHLQHNHLTYLQPGAFHHFEMINKTYLDGNPIREMHENVFRETKVRELWIQDCELANIHPEALTGLENWLHVLQLSANNITQLQVQSLARLEQLRVLGLRDNSISHLEPEIMFRGFQRTLQKMDFGGRKNVMVPLRSYTGIRNLRTLSVSRLPQDQISPHDFEDFGPELDELRVSDGHLKTIKNNAFRHVRGLRFIHLTDSNIGNIEPDAFQEVGHSLLELRMSRGLSSSLRSVPAEVFRHLAILTLLDLSHNRLRTIPANSFLNMRQLQTIWLRDNQLDSIPRGVFHSSSHTQLEEIDLSFNDISSMPEHSFYELEGLERLDLSDNRIRRIDRRAFVNLDQLRRLSLRGNGLHDVEVEAFQNLPTLEDLDLAYNDLTELDFSMLDQVGTLSSFRLNVSHNHIYHLETRITVGRDALYHSSVKILDLSHNNVSTIGRYFFRPIETSITHLYMSRNLLRNASRDVFGNMQHLQWLDLSANLLLEIDFDTFRNTRSLQVLSLSWNLLMEIPGEIFRGLYHLRIVDVSHNRLRSLPDNMWTEPGAERLDVSHNQLSRLPVTAFSAHAAASLVEWDLSHNYLLALHAPDMLSRFRSLQLLDLSHNRLVRLEDAAFAVMPRLATLDLSNNPDLQLDPRGRTFQNLQDSLTDLRLANLTLHQVPELPLPALQSLCLSHNFIVQLPPELASNLTNLRNLDLSHNELTAVPMVTHAFPQLRRLNLADNPISMLTNTSFLGGAENLRELDLRQLTLQHFETGTLAKMPALQSLHLSTYRNVRDFNIPMRLQDNPGLRNLLVEVDEFGHELDGEMRGPLPDKLSNITMTGLRLHSVPMDFFMGVRSPRLLFTLRNTTVEQLPRGLWLQLGGVRNLTLDLRNNSLRHLGNPNQANHPNQRGTFLNGLQISGNRWSCDCELGWVEVWARKKRQYLCPRPQRPLGPPPAQESRDFLYWDYGVDCQEQRDDDLREAFCGSRGGYSVLESLKTDLECGWSSSSRFAAHPKLVLIALTFWTIISSRLLGLLF